MSLNLLTVLEDDTASVIDGKAVGGEGRRVLCLLRAARAPQRGPHAAGGLRPSADPAEPGALLALGRKAAELNKGPWDLLALGLAEYRNGKFDGESLLAAAKASEDPRAAGAASFYRAMALFRQGKTDEAKDLAAKTAAGMDPPLPADEQRPVLPHGSSDLILWLAYKEAKALIGFDAPPAAPAKPDAK